VESKHRNPVLKLPESGFSKPVEKTNYQNCTEREIWTDFKEGSDSALSYIYRKYVNLLFNYGYQITNKDELVQDCIQDLFMDIIRNRQSLADVKSIKFYLITSLRRKIFRKIKQERNHPADDINDQNEARFEIISSPEAIMINEQLTEDKSRLINIACQKLTVKQREAIILFFYEGFSYKQVAEIMAIGKVKSARVLIYRAIDALQSSLIKVKDQLLLLILLFSNSFL
jgi:RNA polymerase sigma factor (sigma-70 family)